MMKEHMLNAGSHTVALMVKSRSMIGSNTSKLLKSTHLKGGCAPMPYRSACVFLRLGKWIGPWLF
jgi:hypothetical protein